jgi:hypothetical protein
MRTPRVPSAQHFARFISRDPELIEKRLRQMAEHPPQINYVPSKKGIRDHLKLGIAPAQVLEGISRIKGGQQKKVNLEATTAFFQLAPQFAGRSFADIDNRYFGIARKLHVPVNPFLYSVRGLHQTILWPSYWSELNLREEQLAAFATILDLAFLDSPDFRGCRLEFIDLGRPPKERVRKPHVIGRGDFSTLTTTELREFTDPFADVFFKLLGEARSAARKAKPTGDIYLDRPAAP